MAQEIKTGTYTGNAAAQNIELGFVPDYVKVVNITDGDDAWEFFSGMTAGHAIYSRAVTDTAATGNASMARITANGITLRSPTDFSGKKGFTIGTALSENTKTFAYVAVRNADY